MQEKDFLYWLKSTFDLFKATSFNDKQTYLIKEHLNIMLKSAPNSIFGNWLLAYFDFNEPIIISEKEVQIIKIKLAKLLNINQIDNYQSKFDLEQSQESILINC